MFQKSNSFILQGDNKVSLSFVDFTGFCPLILNEELKEKMNLFASIQNLSNEIIKSDAQLIELTKNYIANFDIFTKEKNLILKVKISHLYEFFKIMEKTLEEPFNGDKIVIDEQDYNNFFEVALQQLDLNCEQQDIFNFERNLNCVLNLVMILIENSILKSYTQLFFGKSGSFTNKELLFYDGIFNKGDENLYKPVITRVKLHNMEISLNEFETNKRKISFFNSILNEQNEHSDSKTFQKSKMQLNLFVEEQIFDQDDIMLDEMWKILEKEKQTKNEHKKRKYSDTCKKNNENQVTQKKKKNYDLMTIGGITNNNKLLSNLGIRLDLGAI